MSHILYCGDGKLNGAAAYLASVLQLLRRRFDYVPSETRFPRHALKREYSAYILSDYPSSRFEDGDLKKILNRVREGASLLMIGGWGSFHGKDGLYGSKPLAQALPVRCSRRDDRVQGDFTYRIVGGKSGRWSGLSLRTAPGIAGYNKASALPNSQVHLNVHAYGFEGSALRVLRKDPLLVTGRFGAGKTAAYLSDLAPHWAGGLVDWGSKRVKLATPSGKSVEVGETYPRFVKALLEMVKP